MTWYGASAYARHYGKRLLTETEWEYVSSKQLLTGQETLRKKSNHPQIDTDKMSTGNQMHDHMMDMNAAFNTPEERLKTLAPKELLENVKEWAVRQYTEQVTIYEDKSKENIFYPSLVVASARYPDPSSKNFRYPWEAFADVGFRCAASPENAH